MTSQKFISIVIPVYNEEQNIPVLYQLIKNICLTLRTCYDYEIIFVNDGSIDASTQLIEELTRQEQRIKLIEFSRNFGKEAAISAGIKYIKGDAAIIIDADFQHPVELIPQFIKKWEEGAEVVVGIRDKNEKECLIKKLGSFLFYKIMNLIGETKIIPYATDYRLLDRKVIDEFNRFTERNRFSRGLIDWLGFKKDFVHFETKRRQYGKAGYNVFKLTKLALSSFVAHSLFPLKLAGYLGAIITSTSGVFGLFIIIERYILGNPLGLVFSGPFMLGILTLFLGGVTLSCLGLIALYIANIHSEVVNRPLYVIRKKKNFSGAENYDCQPD